MGDRSEPHNPPPACESKLSVVSDPAPPQDAAPPRQSLARKIGHRALVACDLIWTHSRHHIGAGIMASVAYFDPGNWSVDLQAGSQFGMSLLFVVLLSGIGAAFLQTLACRLGCVTGLDLAAHCRLLFADHPRYPRLVRCLFLYPLYVASEIAIIATDLAELLGTAIGLCLLMPRMPLWVGVVATSVDVLIILAITQGGNKRSRVLEFIVMILVLGTFIAFAVLTLKVKPHWPQVLRGYLPSTTLWQPGAVYVGVGILGATVMPHALYLGSSLATIDRLSIGSELPSPIVVPSRRQTLKRLFKGLFGASETSDADGKDRTTPHQLRTNNSIDFIRAHLTHAVVDIVASLLGFAMLINSAILILAATVFAAKSDDSSTAPPAGLFEAHELIVTHMGKFAGYLFALALICAGQSASLTATLSGQIVSEGFIRWKLTPFTRRLITRALSVVPSAAVAASFGAHGIDSLLVGSQVTLSFVLPFVVFPLVYLTSSSVVMRVNDGGQTKSYHNHILAAAVGYVIWILVVLANGYVIIRLSLEGTR